MYQAPGLQALSAPIPCLCASCWTALSDAGVGGQFGVTEEPAKEGSTGLFAIVDPNTFPPITPDSAAIEQVIRGQGSRLSIQSRALHGTLSAGMTFDLASEARVVRVKPSIEYLWERLRAKGIVQRAVLVDTPPLPPSADLSSFRLLSLEEETTDDFHALGPGLEIELDLPRNGHWVMSAFVSGRAYFFLNDTDIDFRATNALGETATFRYERDDWIYRVGLGVRLRLEH